MKRSPAAAPRANRRKGPFGIADAEWDFSEKNIPRNSVHKCLLYEYARELIRRSPEASSTLKKLQAADCSGDSRLRWDSWEAMSSILKTKQSGYVSFYPYMDEVPWVRFQHQLEKERLEIIKRRKPIRQRKSVSKGKKGEHTAEIRKSDAEDSDGLLHRGRGLVLLKNPPYEPGKLYEKFNRSVRAVNAILDTDVRRESCGFFAVDLKARIPDVLEDFEAWLAKEKKQAGIVDAERRGRTSETDKTYKSLKALGAYRLMTLTKLSAAKIKDTFDKLKRPPLYSNAPEWSRAKKSVEEKLRELFVIPADAIF